MTSHATQGKRGRRTARRFDDVIEATSGPHIVNRKLNRYQAANLRERTLVDAQEWNRFACGGPQLLQGSQQGVDLRQRLPMDIATGVVQHVVNATRNCLAPVG